MAALVFGKAAGATTIVTSSSDEKLEQIKSEIGVDFCINYKKHPDWAAEVQRITGGQGVDHIIETTGAGTIRQSFESIARGGIISVIGFMTAIPEEPIPDVTMLTLAKGCMVRGVQGGSKQQLEEVVSFMANRGLMLPQYKAFDFSREGIIKAFECVQSGKYVGKVCINLD